MACVREALPAHSRQPCVMGRTTDSDRSFDARRRREKPWRKWYSLKRWKLRRAAQLKREPKCRYCAAMGKSRIATVANHVIPHRGDEYLFWHGKLESVCKACHDARVQRAEVHGFDASPTDDGWPADPAHPFNAASTRHGRDGS